MALQSRGSLEISHKDSRGVVKVKRIYRRAILPGGGEELQDLELIPEESTATRVAYKDLRKGGRRVYLYTTTRPRKTS